MKLIDLEETKKAKAADKRKKRKEAKKPDANLRFNTPDGKEWFTYSIRYAYQNKNWTVDVMATSEKDAWGRLGAMRNFPVEITQTHSIIK